MEGYHPETEVLLYNRQPNRISKLLRRGDVLMGPDGRPRHIQAVQTVPNTTIPLYQLDLSYNRQLTCTSKDIQVVMGFAPNTEFSPGIKAPFFRAGWFDGSRIVSKNFAIASRLARAWYPTREAAEQAAWQHMEASTPVLVFSETTYPLASIIKYGRHIRHYFPLFYPRCFQYDEQPMTVDPYYLGLWLGDGEKAKTCINSNPSQELEDYLTKYATWLGMKKLTIARRADRNNI